MKLQEQFADIRILVSPKQMCVCDSLSCTFFACAYVLTVLLTVHTGKTLQVKEHEMKRLMGEGLRDGLNFAQSIADPLAPRSCVIFL